jgi:protein involved in polysaccharide export with SLBB domain
VEPIIIDLSKPAMASCLDTPARPGDVVVVPAAGQVGVYGWVDKPGSFNITPGMTALGAITAAGGAMFSSNVEVKRTVRGTRESIPVDLSKVEKGEEPDVPIQAGDVVVVKASAGGAVPYAAYTLFNKLGAGLYMAPAAF